MRVHTQTRDFWQLRIHMLKHSSFVKGLQRMNLFCQLYQNSAVRIELFLKLYNFLNATASTIHFTFRCCFCYPVLSQIKNHIFASILSCNQLLFGYLPYNHPCPHWLVSFSLRASVCETVFCTQLKPGQTA